MHQNGTIATLLHKLAETVEGSSSKDLDALVAGQAALVISPVRSRTIRETAKREIPPSKRRSTRDLAQLVVQLRQLESREEGSTLLISVQLTKRELEEL